MLVHESARSVGLLDKHGMGNTVHKDDPKPSQNKNVAGCYEKCAKFLSITLCVISIILAISEIVVTVTNGLATKLYSTDLSGRLVAMTVLALTAAVTFASSIYAMVGLIKRQKKPLHVSGVVLLVMAIIQALLCGIAVKVTPHDEATLSNSLSQSFNHALEGVPRHYKLWDITHSGLLCCGLNGPDDYQDPGPKIFSPDVPISCCRNYDPSRSNLLQEKERVDCRARRDYYLIGCGALVKTGFRNAASIVLSTTIFFIVLEVILAASSWVVYRTYQKQEEEDHEKGKRTIQVQLQATQNTQAAQENQGFQEEMQVQVAEKKLPEHS